MFPFRRQKLADPAHVQICPNIAILIGGGRGSQEEARC